MFFGSTVSMHRFSIRHMIPMRKIHCIQGGHPDIPCILYGEV
jgi:hypothetical protein